VTRGIGIQKVHVCFLLRIGETLRPIDKGDLQACTYVCSGSCHFNGRCGHNAQSRACWGRWKRQPSVAWEM